MKVIKLKSLLPASNNNNNNGPAFIRTQNAERLDCESSEGMAVFPSNSPIKVVLTGTIVGPTGSKKLFIPACPAPGSSTPSCPATSRIRLLLRRR